MPKNKKTDVMGKNVSSDTKVKKGRLKKVSP